MNDTQLHTLDQVEVFRTAVGGGARIADKFSGDNSTPRGNAGVKSGQRRSAASDPLPS